MFEDMTYESILEDMLSRVTSDVDKHEGSIVYDALAPCAYQLAQTYFNLTNYIDLFFADTSVDEFLDRKAADYGITRKAAAQAVRKIETTGAVDIGTRWGIEDTTYKIVEILDANIYSAICEQLGTIGNAYSGELENIDNVSGVTATLTDIITSGVDEETDDNLRARFYAQIQAPSTSGNANNYKEWALEVAGVGDAKIFPLCNGPGTVKVVIVDSNKQPAASELVQKVHSHIEKVRPIGADVTVVSGTAKAINISVIVILASGYSLQTVNSAFTDKITEYFKTIAFQTNYVSYAKVGTILLSTDGVLDYSGLQLNGTTSNISLADEEIPVMGNVELEV